MRHRAEWQNLLDDRILEIASDAAESGEEPINARDINDRLPQKDYNLDYIRRRCGKLTDAGLLQRVHPDNALWAITDRGQAYLSEEYDVAAGMYIDEMNGNGENDISADERV
ncbi:repressor of nif and glnA expression [Halarchaeum rubridurum]|uniref:Repressor of nif and glnA expression n=1 Tax=Halarchaeum rubridurum TaxID=489911 RepID=A0A830G0L0_9EURY|nr:MarR family transcriptional regulator [Halarchaeum rubridurum]MBP1955066.1 repressor of nif and glnA expression [Halarchaeum rubridurum]GGM69232.1 hypothetical protein GCM10009017_19280 [Halarchaeum rubridurum]